MKYSSLSFGVVSIVTAIVFFLITMQVSFAQTATQLRPATIDVSNVRSELPLDTQKKAPTPTLYNSDESVRKTEVRTIKASVETKDRTTSEPQTFLEKARSVLQEKRDELRKDVDNDRDNKLLNGTTDRDAQLRATDRDDNRALRVAELKEQKKERVSKFLGNIKRKVDAAILRLQTLGERIESRIVKFEERGLDMTKARQLLEVAKGEIRSAQENIRTAVEDAREALANDPSRDSFGGVVSELSKTKENLRSAHASLVEVIRVMKVSLSDKPTDGETDDQNDSPEPSSDTNETETLQTN